jgi:ketosteroid isomerase-like protein
MRSTNLAMLNMRLMLLLGCQLVVAAASAQPQQPTGSPPSAETLHNELRALKDRAVAAVNKRDPEALMKELHPDVTFTAMNNDVVHGVAEAKAYYQKMLLAAGRIIDDMSLTVEPDALSELYDNGNVAISWGRSNAHFKLAAGTTLDVPLRWSATLLRTDGKWSIVSVQFAGNMFDNQLLDTLKSTTKWVAIVAGAAALLVGFLFGRWARRRSV